MEEPRSFRWQELNWPLLAFLGAALLFWWWVAATLT